MVRQRFSGAQCLVGALVIFALINLSMATLMGIDFGSSSYKVVLPPGGKRKQLSLALNEQSSRKTETWIGFREDERLFGSFAVGLAKFSPKDTYPYLRDLLGVSTVKDAVDRVGKYVHYTHKFVVPDSQYEYIAIEHATNQTFAVHELIAMIFKEARKIAEKEDGGKIVDCCITVPVFFTQDERQAIIDAASVAGLSVLSLINQGTAVGVTYGIEQTFEGNFTHNALFFDWGESSLQLTVGQYTPIVEKKKNVTQFQVLGSSWVNLGGRDFTRAMVEHLIETKLRSKIPDVDEKPRIRTKLTQQMTKTKETLSVSPEAEFVIQNLDGSFDFEGSFKRETLEEISKDILDEIVPAVERALKQAGLTKDQIDVIEMVGGTSRIPKAQTILKDYFNREVLDRHLNADEAAAFGAAFFGAGVSGRYKMKGIKVKDIIQRNITAIVTASGDEQKQEDESTEPEEGIEGEREPEIGVVEENPSFLNKTIKAFVKGSKHLSAKKVSFYTEESFQVKLEYQTDETNPLPNGINQVIDTIQFTRIPGNKSDTAKKPQFDIKGYDAKQMDKILGLYNLTAKPKAHVKLRVSSSGIVEVSAVAEIHYMEEKETKVKVVDPVIEPTAEEVPKTEETPKTEEATPKETEEAGSEEAKDEAKEEVKEKPKEKAKKPKERWETKVEWVKKTKEVPLTQISSRGPLPSHLSIKSKDVLEAQEKIEAQRLKVIKLKNDLESSIYEAKEKLYSEELKAVTNETQREELQQALSEISEWLEYESDGATFLTINEKVKELDKKKGPIYFRIHEREALPEAVVVTKETLGKMRDAISEAHTVLEVTEEEVADLVKKIESTIAWVDTEAEANSKLEAHEMPSLTTNHLKKKIENLTGKAKKLMTSPKKKKTFKKPEKVVEEEEGKKEEEPKVEEESNTQGSQNQEKPDL